MIKTTTGMSFWQARFVERKSHCSYLIEQYTSLNCILSDIDDNLAP